MEDNFISVNLGVDPQNMFAKKGARVRLRGMKLKCFAEKKIIGMYFFK